MLGPVGVAKIVQLNSVKRNATENVRFFVYSLCLFGLRHNSLLFIIFFSNLFLLVFTFVILQKLLENGCLQSITQNVYLQLFKEFSLLLMVLTIFKINFFERDIEDFFYLSFLLSSSFMT